jgi:hypothetical protein
MTFYAELATSDLDILKEIFLLMQLFSVLFLRFLFQFQLYFVDRIGGEKCLSMLHHAVLWVCIFSS